MANMCYDYFVGCTQPGPKGPAHVSQPLFITNQKEQLETHTRRTKPLRMD